MNAKLNGNILDITQLHFSYGQQKVLDGLCLQAAAGEFVALTGANGSGKSTLFKLLLKLLTPDSGHIRLFGSDIKDIKDFSRLGYIPQTREFDSGFPATVWEVVRTGLYRPGLFKRLKKTELAAADNALAAVGMDGYKSRLIGKLSGGQLQRVMLARLLCGGASLFLLDEPSSGIDNETSHKILELLQHLCREHGICVIMITHDMSAAASYADKKLCLSEGKLSSL